MPFDSTQPTNTTKIRNLGVVIRPNWEAIEQGLNTFKPHSLNLNNRTALGIPVDPAAVPNTYILYCKQDASGNPQLYGIDQGSRVAQISASATPTSATVGCSWLAGGMLIQWGISGNIGVNADSTILFYTPFSAVPYSVTITGIHNGGEVVSGNVHTITAGNFVLRNTSVSARRFYWTAIGPKV